MYKNHLKLAEILMINSIPFKVSEKCQFEIEMNDGKFEILIDSVFVTMIDKNKDKTWYFETDSDKIEEMYKAFILYMLHYHSNMAIEMMNDYIDNNCKKHRCPICEDCLDEPSVVDIYKKTGGIYGLFE